MNGAKKMLLVGYDLGATECMVEYEIDLDAILDELGTKAWRNRSKRTRALGGRIVVKVRPTIAAKER